MTLCGQVFDLDNWNIFVSGADCGDDGYKPVIGNYPSETVGFDPGTYTG